MSEREDMLAERERQLALHPGVTSAGELALFMGEHESEYWRWQLGKYFDEVLGKPIPRDQGPSPD